MASELKSKPRVVVLGDPLPLVDVISKGQVEILGNTNDPRVLPSLLKTCSADYLIIFTGTSLGGKDLSDLIRAVSWAYPGLEIAVLTDEVNGKYQTLASSLGDTATRLVFPMPWDMEEVIKRLSEGLETKVIGRALPASLDPNGTPHFSNGWSRPQCSKKEVFPASQVCEVDYDLRRWLDSRGVITADPGGTARKEVLPPQVIAVYSPKAGVGKTFVASNIAAILSAKLGGNVILLDLDVKYADAGVYFDLAPSPNIIDFLPYSFDATTKVFDECLQKHLPSNLSVLLGPSRPELSDLLTAEHISTVLELSKETHRICIIDTPSDPTSDLLHVCLSHAWTTVLVASQDASLLRHFRICMDLAERAGVSIKKNSCLVINKAETGLPLSFKTAEEFLEIEKSFVIPEDRYIVESSILSGKPVVLSRNANSEVETALKTIARFLYPSLEADPGEGSHESHKESPSKRSSGLFFWRQKRTR